MEVATVSFCETSADWFFGGFHDHHTDEQIDLSCSTLRGEKWDDVCEWLFSWDKLRWGTVVVGDLF